MTEATTEARIEHLIDVVERDREHRMQKMRDEAHTQAAALLAEARAEARRGVRSAIREASSREQRRIDAAHAELESNRRQIEQRTSAQLLERAWAKLEPALAERWSDPASRQQWIQSAIDLASRELPRAQWCIEHPEDLDPGQIAEDVENATGHRPSVRASDSLDSGLRIHVAGTTLDASPTGLLAQASEVEAMLLGHLLPRDEDLSERGDDR